MQNEQTLIDLGFKRYPEWDFKSNGQRHYMKVVGNKTFRAYAIECNGPTYVTLGEVISPSGIVTRWMDCCSDGSVQRKINS